MKLYIKYHRGACLKALLLIASICAGNINAAVAPSTGEKFQERAPEKIDVIVLESSSKMVDPPEPFGDDVEVVTKLNVIHVERSLKKLKKHQVIEVRYTVKSVINRPPGDWPRVITAGRKYTAFLRWNEKGKYFEPAAISYSFVPKI
ncbi:MAG: hypothetical protein AB8F34_04655 [Akkermansiaceae bacterium]